MFSAVTAAVPSRFTEFTVRLHPSPMSAGVPIGTGLCRVSTPEARVDRGDCRRHSRCRGRCTARHDDRECAVRVHRCGVCRHCGVDAVADRQLIDVAGDPGEIESMDSSPQPERRSWIRFGRRSRRRAMLPTPQATDATTVRITPAVRFIEPPSPLRRGGRVVERPSGARENSERSTLRTYARSRSHDRVSTRPNDLPTVEEIESLSGPTRWPPVAGERRPTAAQARPSATPSASGAVR